MTGTHDRLPGVGGRMWVASIGLVSCLVCPVALGQAGADDRAEPRAGTTPAGSVRQVAVSDDPRSIILLRYDCRSDLGRREVSLFGNGVIRVRESEPEVAEGEGELQMRLHTLDPDSFEGYRNRLADEDLSGAEVERGGVDGEWVEQCVFEILDRRGAAGEGRALLRRFEFSPYSRLPLELSRAVRVAEELAAEAEGPQGPGLPPRYEPRPGDVLERSDGELFRVIAYTVDLKGVELQGVDAPLVLYLNPDDLRNSFVRLVTRDEDGWR